MDYASYITSKKWQARRVSFFHTRGRRDCQACGATDDVQVHHRTYERLGRELDSDMTALCQRCHDAVHRLHRFDGTLTLAEATDAILAEPGRRVAKPETPSIPVGRQPSSVDQAAAKTRGRQKRQAPTPPWKGFGSKKDVEITQRIQIAEAERLVDQLLRKSAQGAVTGALTYAERQILERCLKTLQERPRSRATPL